MRRIAIYVALALLVGLGGSIYRLFYDDGAIPDRPFRLDLDDLRAASARMPGPLPNRIEVETVSHDAVPRIAMVTGTDWGKVDLIRTSYRVVFPGRSIVIDTGHDEAEARRFAADRFDRGAYRRIQDAMAAADAVLVTHEHADHLGGAVTSPRLGLIAPKLMLTAEQLGSREGPPWPAAIQRPRPLRYGDLQPVTPGVVLVRAPGHTPGSQMIYVRQADGREFLFMGDVASMADNVRLGRQRSRYVTRFVSGGDRPAVTAQLRALGELSRRHPDLVLVPGHDATAIDDMVARRLLVRGFRP